MISTKQTLGLRISNIFTKTTKLQVYYYREDAKKNSLSEYWVEGKVPDRLLLGSWARKELPVGVRRLKHELGGELLVGGDGGGGCDSSFSFSPFLLHVA